MFGREAECAQTARSQPTLYMSQRSVEAHLTKVYRDLGVRSCAQLVAALSADRSAAGNGSSADE